MFMMLENISAICTQYEIYENFGINIEINFYIPMDKLVLGLWLCGAKRVNDYSNYLFFES